VRWEGVLGEEVVRFIPYDIGEAADSKA